MRTLASGMVLLLATASVSGQGSVAYVSAFGRRILSQCQQIVEGSVSRVLPPFRGVSTARLRVEHKLRGYDRARELTLFYIEDYLPPDAFQSTLERGSLRYRRRREKGATREQAGGLDARGRGTGVRLAAGQAGLFFLKRKGLAYSLIAFLPAKDPLYRTKRQRLVEILRLESIVALDLRVRAAKEFFLAALADPNPWGRGNAARELLGLATRFRDSFSGEDAHALMKRLAAEQEVRIRSSLERAVRALDPHLVVAFERAEERKASKQFAGSIEEERARLQAIRIPELRAAGLAGVARRYRRAATPLLAGFLADPAPIVRERAAQALAASGSLTAQAPLRKALARERNRNATAAMIYACGMNQDAEAIPLLERRLGAPDLEVPALQALARIGTPAAESVLRSHRKQASAEIRRLIDDLLREEFS